MVLIMLVSRPWTSVPCEKDRPSSSLQTHIQIHEAVSEISICCLYAGKIIIFFFNCFIFWYFSPKVYNSLHIKICNSCTVASVSSNLNENIF